MTSLQDSHLNTSEVHEELLSKRRINSSQNNSMRQTVCWMWVTIGLVCLLTISINISIASSQSKYQSKTSTVLENSTSTLNSMYGQFQSTIFTINTQQRQQIQQLAQMVEAVITPKAESLQQAIDNLTVSQQKIGQKQQEVLDVYQSNSIEVEKIKTMEEHLEVPVKAEVDPVRPLDPYHLTPNIPPTVYAFSETYPYTTDNYLHRLALQNIQNAVPLSNLKIITAHNYFYHLLPADIQHIDELLSILHRLPSDHHNLWDHFDTIKRVVIMLKVLERNGGTVIPEPIVLTQDLSWIKNVTDYGFVNRGNGDTRPKVVSFFDNYFSSTPKRHGVVGKKGAQQYITKFPSIEKYFIAAQKSSQFIRQLNAQIALILKNPFDLPKQIKVFLSQISGHLGKDPYYQFLYMAGQIVLKKKQRQLDQIHISQDGKPIEKFAIDYYGFYSINSIYGPSKLKYVMGREHSLALLRDWKMTQMDQKIGPVSFVAFFNQEYETMNKALLSLHDQKQQIVNGSFLHKILLPDHPSDNLINLPNDPLPALVPGPELTWEKLPRKIWIYKSPTHADSPLVNMIINRTKTVNKKAGFEAKVVDSLKLDEQLGWDTAKALRNVWKSSKYKSNPYLFDYLKLITVLSKQGGVLMDSSILPIGDFSWLLTPGTIPAHQVWNRIGELPSMLMFFNPHLGVEPWHKKLNYTRLNPAVPLEPSFIAVQQDHLLIEQLQEDLMTALTRTPEQNIANIAASRFNHTLLFEEDANLLPMDLLRAAYASAQHKSTEQQPPPALWTIDGDYSLYKLSNAQYSSKEQGLLWTRYPQDYVEQVIGTMCGVIKMSEQEMKFLEGVLSKGRDENKGQIDVESVFNQHISGWYDRN